jgi:hypothetical protein
MRSNHGSIPQTQTYWFRTPKGGAAVRFHLPPLKISQWAQAIA